MGWSVGAALSGSVFFTLQDGESTAVERLAAELLQLTNMHPDTRWQLPFNLDPIEDAELIESDKRAMEDALEVQPQIEAAMMDAAKLLCDLTGEPLPPWMNGNTTLVKAEINTTSSNDIPGKLPKTSIGKLAIKAAWQIERETGKGATANQVIDTLQKWEPDESTITNIIPHGVKWETTKGIEKPFDVTTCAKTLATWNQSRT